MNHLNPYGAGEVYEATLRGPKDAVTDGGIQQQTSLPIAEPAENLQVKRVSYFAESPALLGEVRVSDSSMLQ